MITFNIRTNSEDKIVDSIEVLDDGYLAAKYALHSYIYIWHAQHSVAEVNKESRVLEIVPLYKLEWCETDNYYMEIGSNCGNYLFIFRRFLSSKFLEYTVYKIIDYK